jgi:hypothetical protein
MFPPVRRRICNQCELGMKALFGHEFYTFLSHIPVSTSILFIYFFHIRVSGAWNSVGLTELQRYNGLTLKSSTLSRPCSSDGQTTSPWHLYCYRQEPSAYTDCMKASDFWIKNLSERCGHSGNRSPVRHPADDRFTVQYGRFTVS